MSIPYVCSICEHYIPIHPGAILCPKISWKFVLKGQDVWQFEKASFPTCPECERVIGRCPTCGGSATSCECPAPESKIGVKYFLKATVK